MVIHTYTHYIHHPHGHTQFIRFYISQSFYISVLRNTFYSYFLLFFYHPFRCLSLSIFLYLLLSLRLHEHFMFSFDSFVFSCASFRAPPYLLAHRRYLHCVPMSDLISREAFFEIDVTKRVLTRKGRRTLFPDLPMLPSYPRRDEKLHSSLSARKTLNFLPRAYPAGKKGRSTFTFHRSAFREQPCRP